MRLRRVAGMAAGQTAHGGRNRRERRRGPSPLPPSRFPREPPLLPQLLKQSLVRQVAGGRDDAIAGEVRLAVELLQIVGGECADRIPRAEDREPVRMLWTHSVGQRTGNQTLWWTA